MTLAERSEAFKRTFAKWPASWPWLVEEQGRPVLYGIWLIGNDYKNPTRYYGAYPKGFLDRVMALFPDVKQEYNNFEHAGVLHAFSGSLQWRDVGWCTLDVNPDLQPTHVGSVYDVAEMFQTARDGPVFKLVIADPPYTRADATKYGTPMIDRRRAVAALADITRPGGHLAWLDTCWPMHSKTQWLTVGRILVQRSTNHRARVLSIFERAA